MFKCKICSKKFNKHLGLMKHISIHNYNSEKYYKEFLKKENEGFCLECGNPTKFHNASVGYRKFCSLKCSSKYEHKNFTEKQKKERLEKIKKTNIKKYGVENPIKNKKIRKKIKETNIKKYGEKYPTAYGSNGFKKRMKEKYGSENPTAYGTENFKKRMKEKYNVENVWQSKQIKEKIKEQHLQIKEKKEKTCLKNYGTKYYLQSQEGKNNFSKNKEKMKKNYNKTCQKKYGVDWYIQSESKNQKIKRYDKVWKSKKENRTTNSSKVEQELFSYLLNKYENIERNFKTKEYPFHCDFYIKDLNLYIELQGFWTHGYRAFLNTKEDNNQLFEWKKKAETSTFFKNGINIWTKKDVKKREIALKNNLRFLEIFDYSSIDCIQKQIDRIINGLSYSYSEKEMRSQYKSILDKQGNFNSKPNYNKIILTFQPHFYEKENYLFKTNPIIRRKLIQNRIKYLNKSELELSDRDLLRGFKISGIYKGYSHFSPLWIKQFINEYKIKRLYDPCGGWGHRLLGSHDLDLYIYNDLNEKTLNGVKKINQFLNLNNTIFYNNDCSIFSPEQEFDAIFLSPPYYNIEDYGSNFNSFKEYLNWINNIIKINNNKKYKYFCLVINNKYEKDLLFFFKNFKLIKKEILYNQKNHFNKDSNFHENLIIFQKGEINV